MKKKMVWLVVSCLMVLALLVTSCAKAEEKAPEAAPVVKEAAPAVKEVAPAVKEVAPAVKEAAPAVKEVAPAAKEAPRYGGVLNVVYTQAIQNWDEAYGAPWGLANPLELINEELLQGNWSRGPAGTGEVSWNQGAWMRLDFMEGMLAESWEFTDPVTAVFHIRKGVRWALDPSREASRLVNGRELTADDIVWNLKRILWEIKTSTMYGWVGDASRPTEIYAPDKYTVVVKSPPDQMGLMFEVVTDHLRIMAPEVGKKYGDFALWENTVGTGPFMVKDHVAMSSVTFVKNPNYWGKDPVGPGKGNPLPYLDGFKTLIIPDLSTRLAATRTGKLAHSEALMPEDASQLKKTSPGLPYIRQLTRTNTLAMRLDANYPWNDIRVRRALAMAIDNEAIKNTYYCGEAEILAWKLPPTSEYKDEYTPLEQIPLAADGFDTRKLYGYYPEEAKKLLAEAGYPNGFKTTIDVVSSGNYGPDIPLIAKEYWKKNLNVDLELIIREPGIHESMRIKKTHGPMFMYGRTYSPYQMPSFRVGNAWNSGMVNDPKMDEYYDRLNALYFETDKAALLMKEVNLYMIETAYYWPPPAPYTYVFWQPWLKNYYGVTGLGAWNTNQELKYVWIDQELRKRMGH